MPPPVSVPRLVIASPSSGSGKTTVVVALARALRRRGFRVVTFKCGPDYLDPTYHARATGTVSPTLDGWMMGQAGVVSTFNDAAAGADIALIEGMMGLFDGATATTESGSTAEIALWLRAPVVLVVDVSAMARSIAALVHGFRTYDPRIELAGVIANRVGSRDHLQLVQAATAIPPLLGGLPNEREHSFPERHLGLVRADAKTLPDATLDHWATLAEEWLNLDAVRASASATPVPDVPTKGLPSASGVRCRIGIARDVAFDFYYEENLRLLRDHGAELVAFSPLEHAVLPDVDGVYFGGGYPELHGFALETNAMFRESVRRFIEDGGPVYAECGGLMYLTGAIRLANGQVHRMVGAIAAEVTMSDSLRAIGYVEAEAWRETILGPVGTRLRGHQFRYSELRNLAPTSGEDDAFVLRSPSGAPLGSAGIAPGNVLATYVHAHFASNPDVPGYFVERCAQYRRKRGK